MLTIVVVLGIWTALSLPVSVVVAFLLRDDSQLELVGMDGDVAVYCGPNGELERVSLGDRATH
jgi:hypothetical protein